MKKLTMTNWVCYAIGFVFIASGAYKLVESGFRLVFLDLGIPYPGVMVLLVAVTEIVCGALVAGRLHLKRATLPLIVIMLAAVLLTKLPVLTAGQGVLEFLFKARLDLVMLFLLIVLWQQAPGKVFK